MAFVRARRSATDVPDPAPPERSRATDTVTRSARCDEQFDRWEGGDLDVDPGAVALEVRGEAAARVAGQHELREDQQRQQDAGEGEQASAHGVTLRDRHTRLGKPKAPRGALFLAAAFLVVVVFTVIGLAPRSSRVIRPRRLVCAGSATLAGLAAAPEPQRQHAMRRRR